jgi:hypothetical protein
VYRPQARCPIAQVHSPFSSLNSSWTASTRWPSSSPLASLALAAALGAQGGGLASLAVGVCSTAVAGHGVATTAPKGSQGSYFLSIRNARRATVLAVVTKTRSGVRSMAKAMAELRRRVVPLSRSRQGLFPLSTARLGSRSPSRARRPSLVEWGSRSLLERPRHDGTMGRVDPDEVKATSGSHAPLAPSPCTRCVLQRGKTSSAPTLTSTSPGYIERGLAMAGLAMAHTCSRSTRC